MAIYEWLLVAAAFFAIAIGLFRLNSTIAVASLFCITFTLTIAAGQSQNWRVATYSVMAIFLGLILTGFYYLARRYSPWRKAAANPPA
jgi:hypothetical protein